jgi:peptide/nickel transport system substrate-binding protein
VGALGLLVGAGGGATNPAAAQARGAASSPPPLTVTDNNSGALPNDNNPLVGNGPDLSIYDDWDLVYEPLLGYNNADPGASYPWLATRWSFSDGGKTLTFDLRKNVKWSDGVAFTSADVAFTLELIKKYSALNLYGINLNSVSAPNASTVVVHFPLPAYTELYFFSEQPIVPAHIWSKVKDPVTYEDTDPIGTGPYVLASYAPTEQVYKANPLYWQPVPVKEVEFLAFASANTYNSEVNDGQVQWATNDETDVQKAFVDRDPQYNHYWFPSISSVQLVPNLTVYPLGNVAVRKAISDVIDRKLIDSDGESGYEPPITSATGIWSAAASYIGSQFKNDLLVTDVSAAKSVLKAAGFSWNSAGALVGKGNKPVPNLTCVAPSDWDDYPVDCTIIASELKSIGISASFEGVTDTTYFADLADGSFDLAPAWAATGPTPYYAYNSLLNDALSAPIGKTASGDYERWFNTATQRYLTAYANSGTKTAQGAALDGLEAVMVNDLPVIPMVGSADWGMYNDRYYTGWPTPANHPLGNDSPAAPNLAPVLLHLRARS